MATLKFCRGNIRNMAISDGQFIVDTSLYQVYTDIDTKRFLLGGVIEVADKTALDSLNAANIPTNVLYYVSNDNSLYKSNGATFVKLAGDSGESAGDVTIEIRYSPSSSGDYVKAVTVADDGALVITMGTFSESLPSYAIEKLPAAEGNYLATYQLVKIEGESRTPVSGDKINLPKDLVIQSGSFKIVEFADTPYDGANIGDPYIDLVINTVTDAQNHIYIPVKGLIDVYTAGNGININDNVISLNVELNNGLTIKDGVLSLGLASSATTDTSATAGAMSATDKEFLDSIPDTYATKADLDNFSLKWIEFDNTTGA